MKTKTEYKNGSSGCYAAAAAFGLVVATGGQCLAQNVASGASAYIGGGINNTASGDQSSILGGVNNTASGAGTSILGGQNNTAAGQRSGILTGFNNSITGSGNTAAILGGAGNVVSGNSGGVMTGSLNQNSGTASLVLTAAGSTLTGPGSVLGGSNSTLASSNSFMWARDISHATPVAGIVYLGDNSRGGTVLNESFPSNTMACRFDNGFRFFTDSTSSGSGQFVIDESGNLGVKTSTPTCSLDIFDGSSLPLGGNAAMRIGNPNGLHLAFDNNEIQASSGLPSSDNPFTLYLNFSGGDVAVGSSFGESNLSVTGSVTVDGTLVHASDKNLKTDFESLDSDDVLKKISEMPVTTWRWKTDESGRRHVGPMAQDFQKAFSLGEDDKHIAPLDVDGVTLIAIQGLNQKLEEKNAEIQGQNAEIQALNERLEKLESMIKASNK